jgi:hypothetical protein
LGLLPAYSATSSSTVATSSSTSASPSSSTTSNRYDEHDFYQNIDNCLMSLEAGQEEIRNTLHQQVDSSR